VQDESTGKQIAAQQQAKEERIDETPKEWSNGAME
jgi:hypothetical protein